MLTTFVHDFIFKKKIKNVEFYLFYEFYLSVLLYTSESIWKEKGFNGKASVGFSFFFL